MIIYGAKILRKPIVPVGEWHSLAESILESVLMTRRLRMYKHFAIWLLLMVACFSVSGQAQAMQTQCSSSPVPAGWVIIHVSTDFTRFGGTNNDIETIEQILTLGTGATVSACASNVLPAGWVFRDVATDFTDCFGSSNNKLVLLNLNGEPPGTSFSVCSGQAPPSGWVVQDVATDFTRCFGSNNNLRIFINLNGLALGAQESVCVGNTLPTGWVITGNPTDFTRCFGAASNIDVITLTVNVSLTRSPGFTGAISLSTSGLPSDANPTFNPNPAPGASSTLTVTGSANAITFHPTISGTSGNVPCSTQPQVTLNVTDFSISLNPPSLTITQGGVGASVQVTINSINGFSGSVGLGPVNVPGGVAFSFSS